MLPETFTSKEQKEKCLTYLQLAKLHWENLLARITVPECEKNWQWHIEKNKAFDQTLKETKKIYPYRSAKNNCFLCQYVKEEQDLHFTENELLNCPRYCPVAWTDDTDHRPFDCEIEGSAYLDFIEQETDEEGVDAAKRVLSLITDALDKARSIPVKPRTIFRPNQA